MVKTLSPNLKSHFYFFSGKRSLVIESENEAAKKSRLAMTLIKPPGLYVPLKKSTESIEDVKKALNVVETQIGEEMDVPPVSFY